MNRSRTAAAFVFTALSCAAVFTTPLGCSSSPPAVGSSETMTARQFLGQLDQMPGQIDGLTSALEGLQTTDTKGLSNAFSKFMSSSRDVNAQASRVRIEADKMNAGAGDYFKKWDGEIKGADTAEGRAAARDTQAAAAGKWNVVQQYMDNGKRQFGEMNDSVTAIKDGLTKNLSADSVKTLQPQIERALKSGRDAKNTSMRLSEEIRKALKI